MDARILILVFDLAAALPAPVVAALIAGLSARLAASRIVGEMP